jgi:hypothetical protein
MEKNMKTFLLTLSALILISFGACTADNTERNTLKSIETGTGRALDNANSVIRTGAENGDKVWNTNGQ